MKPFLLLFLICLGLKDAKDQYISKIWLLPSVLLIFGWNFKFDMEHILGTVLFGLPAFIMYKKQDQWIGSADVCYLFYFGGMLGLQRMIIAMLISLPIGIVWSIKNRQVPFITCLCIGVWIAYLYGYGIWYHFIL